MSYDTFYKIFIYKVKSLNFIIFNLQLIVYLHLHIVAIIKKTLHYNYDIRVLGARKYEIIYLLFYPLH
jgi:hypothetical protein